MAMGKRESEWQGSMWNTASEVASGPSHLFYEQLNQAIPRSESIPSK
jgi:hypothetical protein